MRIPQIGETISAEDLHNISIGQTISAEEFEKMKQPQTSSIFKTTTQPTAEQPQEKRGILQKVGGFLGVEGLGKGISSAILTHTDKEYKRILDKVSRGEGMTPGEKSYFESISGEIPTSGEVVGSAAQTAATIATLGGAAKAKAGWTGLKGILSQSAKMAPIGATFAAGRAVEEGKNQKEVLNEIVWGGLFGAAVPFIGAGLGRAISPVKKAITQALPKRLMQNVFKMAKDDVNLAFKSIAKGQTPNPTLAEEALREGFRGGHENMAKYAINKLDLLEKQIQPLVKKTVVEIPKKKGYIDLLKGIEKEFSKGFFTERGAEAKQLANQLTKTKGNKISGELALNIRRFLDKIRSTSSFKLDPKLAPKQEEFKVAANTLRSVLRKSSPQFSELMNKERIMIEAFDAVVDSAVRQGNKNLLNLTDVLLGGGGMATGFPGAGFGAMAGVRAFQQPVFLTNLAQGLYKAGQAQAPETLKRLGTQAVLKTETPRRIFKGMFGQ